MKIQTLLIGAAIGYALAKMTAKPCPNCGVSPELPFSGQTPTKTTLGAVNYFQKQNAMMAGCGNGTRLFNRVNFSNDSERMAFLTA